MAQDGKKDWTQEIQSMVLNLFRGPTQKLDKDFLQRPVMTGQWL